MKLRLSLALSALVVILFVSAFAACQDRSSSESGDPATRRNMVGTWRSVGSQDDTTRYFFSNGTWRERITPGGVCAMVRYGHWIERSGRWSIRDNAIVFEVAFVESQTPWSGRKAGGLDSEQIVQVTPACLITRENNVIREFARVEP